MAKTQVTCPGCQKNYQVDDSLLGKRARCARCKTSFVLPTREAVAVTWSSPWPWVTERQPGAAPPSLPPERRAPAEDGVPEIWEPGDVILDRYEVREVFTSGGMGLVYRVRHRGWNIDLAVKCPRLEFFRNDLDKENFKQEAETWVKLGLHPHTVHCYYVRQMGGIPRVFAEFVSGGSLEEWIRSRRLYRGGPERALGRLLDVAIQFAWGLQHAHENGLVHRDVKPGNLLLTTKGIAKVTDFGMARARGVTAEPAAAAEGRSVLVSAGGMTPAFCSPEQISYQPVSRKTDVWSWGVSVLEMFCGDVTWTAGYLAADVLKNYLKQPPPEPDLPRMPAALADLLQRCFRKDQDARPRDMLEIVTELRAAYREATGGPYPRTAPLAAEALADGLNNRAVSLLDLNKQAEAEQLWEEALAAGPGHPESTYNLALSRWRAGQIPLATVLQKLQEVCAGHPGSWLPLYLLAQIHLEQADWAAAVRTLEQVGGAAAVDEVRAALAAARERLNAAGRRLRTFAGHTDRASSVCLSGDGRYALSGSADRTLRLWDLADGRCLRTFEGHKDWVSAVCLSGDGRFALSGSADRTLRFWDVASGQCLHTFGEHTKWLAAVALSGDSRLALSGDGDGHINLWETASGKLVRGFYGHTGSVLSVCLSADGRFALSGGRDATLRLWDVAGGQCLRTFEGHADKVLSVSLSADGRSILSGSSDRTVRLWEADTGRCLRTYEGHDDGVFSVALTADGHYALSGSGDRTAKVWKLALEQCLDTLEGHTGAVDSVALSADGCYALTGSGDKTLSLWSLPANPVAPYMVSRVRSSETAHAARTDYEQALKRAWQAVSSGDARLAARLLREARAQPGYERWPEAVKQWGGLYVHLPRKALSGAWEGAVLEGHLAPVTSVWVSGDGRHVLSGSADRTLKLWEVAGGQCLGTLAGHTGVVTAVCLSGDGRYALSGSTDHTLRLWDVAAGQCLRTFEGHADVVTSVALSTDTWYALSGSSDRTLKLWETATGRCLRTFTGHADPVHSVVLSADGRFALSGGGQYLIRNESERLFTSGELKWWEVATGRCLPTFAGHADAVTSVALSIEGRYALAGGGKSVLQHQTGRFTPSGQFHLYEVASGRCLGSLTGHGATVTSVCLSLDGSYALSGSIDKTLRLWAVKSGRCLRTFQGHTGAITAAALSGDCRFAVSASADRTLRLWILDWELGDNAPADWDEGARPYLETFLTQRTPYAAPLPAERKGTLRDIGNLPLSRLFKGAAPGQELALALTRRGKPIWTVEAFEGLLYTLGCAGYGWLRPDGVQRQLEQMARQWQGPPPVTG
jgi:predicted Zn finger-like uncharacterized protein